MKCQLIKHFYFIEPVSPFNKIKSALHPNGFTAKKLVISQLKILWKNEIKLHFPVEFLLFLGRIQSDENAIVKWYPPKL